MAEKKPSKQQLFSQVKQLCLKGKFKDSRYLICQASGLEIKEPMQISRNTLRQMTKDKIIHQMLDVEQAFVAVAKTFNQETPEEHHAEITSKELKNILPLLSRSEKLTAYYWINNCYSYITNISAKERLYILQNIISLIPQKKHHNLIYGCANQIINLAIPAQEKYQTIKKAYQKADKKSFIIPHMKDFLNKTGHIYFQELYKQLNNSQLDYTTRHQAAYKAIQVCNDLKTSISKKCNLKIKILQNLYKIQIKQQNKTDTSQTIALLCKYAQQLENIKSLMGINERERELYR